MTEPDAPELYAEPGSTWWPVLWGPVFAVAGAGLEALTGRVHGVAWLLVGLGLAGAGAVWVNGRRRLLSVRLTTRTLRQGAEELEVAKIAEVDGVGTPVGVKVLGGGWAVPRRFDDIPIRLTDGSVVLAWAKDGEALRSALRGLAVSGSEVE